LNILIGFLKNLQNAAMVVLRINLLQDSPPSLISQPQSGLPVADHLQDRAGYGFWVYLGNH
jgi:hypothetical protein